MTGRVFLSASFPAIPLLKHRLASVFGRALNRDPHPDTEHGQTIEVAPLGLPIFASHAVIVRIHDSMVD